MHYTLCMVASSLLTRRCAKTWLQVIVGSPDLKANHNIDQVIELVQPYEKPSRLRALLQPFMTSRGPGGGVQRVLVFCDTKRGCDEMTMQLRMDGWPALALHGDKSQVGTWLFM